MTDNAHMTSPHLRRSISTTPVSTTLDVAQINSHSPAEVYSTPPPVQTTGWLDPNLPTPPTYAADHLSHHGSRPDSPLSKRASARNLLAEAEKGGGAEPRAEADVEAKADARRVEDMLTRGEVMNDPILSRLAEQQARSAAVSGLKAQRAAVRRRLADAGGAGQSASGVPGGDAGPVYVFKAKPAPATTAKATGPRLSKAAALRMGVYEPTEREKERSERERRKEEEAAEKARKRIARQSLTIASLAPPILAPKQNRTAQLRSGVPAESITALNPTSRLKTAEEVEADKQQRLKEERERRRQSVTLPASYSVPSITPRMNRTTVLRTGTALPPISTPRGALQPSTAQNARDREAAAARDAKAMPPPSFVRPTTSTGASTRKTAVGGQVVSAGSSRPTTSAGILGKMGKTHDEARDGKEGDMRRSSTVLGVRSLGTPSIVPRLNKTAMLRTTPRPSTSAGTTTNATLKAPSTGTAPSTTPSSRALGGIGQRNVGPGPEVKQTKASLLRAAALAKKQSS